MTTYEHVMLGVTGSLAAGLHRRGGWEIVAMAGVVAALPDWDGLSILLGAEAFDRFHRAVGHNLLVAGLLGAAWAAWDYRGGATRRVVQVGMRCFPSLQWKETAPRRRGFDAGALSLWIAVGVLASLSHLAADLVYSGHEDLSDWGLKLLWPFSDRSYVYPLVRWGDVGATLIFAAGMLAMARWRERLQAIAALTLFGVLGYIGVRGVW